MKNNTEEKVISYGLRGTTFKQFIVSLLKRGNIKNQYIRILTSPTSMQIYDQSFTTQEANEENNEEFFEQLGDQTANHFIVWYAYRRFPQLKCPKGVKVVARLRINYGSREIMSKLADDLGFWPHITATEEQKSRQKKDRLEDAFEAFCGATEYILDEHFEPGVGNAIVYRILKSIYDEIEISLDFDALYDSKTKLKEVFDTQKQLGSVKYEETREETEDNMGLTTSKVYIIHSNRQKQLIGVGTAAKKSDAQQNAAIRGLHYMRSKGLAKSIPEEYKRFAEIGDTVEKFKNK